MLQVVLMQCLMHIAMCIGIWFAVPPVCRFRAKSGFFWIRLTFLARTVKRTANGQWTMTRVVTGSCGNLQLCAFYFVFHSCLSSGDYRRCTKASRLLELHQCPVTMGGPQTLLNYMHIVHGL